MPRLRSSCGQASVEMVAVLPLAAVVLAVLWQAVVAGQAVWGAAGAARAAARAQAVGGDVRAAARGALPGSLRSGVRVREGSDGVRVGIRIPLVLTKVSLGTIEGRAQLPPQGS
ncbi:MAG: pilus assembly protein [Solirubrobacteraceae bacterium]